MGYGRKSPGMPYIMAMGYKGEQGRDREDTYTDVFRRGGDDAGRSRITRHHPGPSLDQTPENLSIRHLTMWS